MSVSFLSYSVIRYISIWKSDCSEIYIFWSFFYFFSFYLSLSLYPILNTRIRIRIYWIKHNNNHEIVIKIVPSRSENVFSECFLGRIIFFLMIAPIQDFFYSLSSGNKYCNSLIKKIQTWRLKKKTVMVSI